MAAHFSIMAVNVGVPSGNKASSPKILFRHQFVQTRPTTLALISGQIGNFVHAGDSLLNPFTSYRDNDEYSGLFS